MTLPKKKKLKLSVYKSSLKRWMAHTEYLATLIHRKSEQKKMKFPSKPKDEYLVKDPNLNIHFKIINGVRYWLTPLPSSYKK